ncbi:MAG: FAD-binding dehydrogenase, partial [Bacteroidota bacterium]
RRLEESQYAFVTFLKNEHVQIKGSQRRITGVLSVFNKINKAVSNYGKQEPPQELGIDAFEFWIPERRPSGHNIAMQISPGLEAFSTSQLTNGFTRPYRQSNAWVADPLDSTPTLEFHWKQSQTIKVIQLHFDTDFDHPLESSLLGHPEREMPFCVKRYSLYDGNGKILHREENNHQTINRITLDQPVTTNQITLKLQHPSADIPAALFGVYFYPD